MMFSRLSQSVALLTLVLAGSSTVAAGAATAPSKTGLNPYATGEDAVRLATRCAMLDDPAKRERMDGLLTELIYVCGRFELLGQVVQESDEAERTPDASTDARVNNITGENSSRVQNETALAYNESTGTICSGFNDSYSGVTLNANFTGFSRSTDGGVTWSDGGQLAPPPGQRSFGDPAIVWRKSDGKVYMSALHSSGGLGFWRSDDDCATFTWVGLASANTNDDKELLAVDNTIASPYYGRIYLAWTDFNLPGTQIVERHTDNGGATWTAQQSISAVLGGAPQGAWPAVAPNGTVYVAWVDRTLETTISMQVVRSLNGGGAWAPVATQPAVNVVNPRDSAATSTCGRPALKGNIRYLPSPQIAVGPDNVLHIVYTRDPDTQNSGDASNVYYRRSTDAGATWSAEVKLNDDATTSDQFFASLSIGATNFVGVGWYDRREDVNNLRINYYSTTSYDGGLSWQPNVKNSDVDSPVVIDTGLAACYHADYDTHIQTPVAMVRQWGDDRPDGSGSDNSNVYVDTEAVSTNFLVLSSDATESICAGAEADYPLSVPQFQAFVESVTLSSTGAPGGTSSSFSTNPVTPPGTSNFTVGNTAGVAFGTYSITITGTSSPSAIVHTAELTLQAFTAAGGAPGLTTPADVAVDVSLLPQLVWTAGLQATTYTVEVATDAGFTSIVYTQSGIEGLSHTVATSLQPLTQYFWRARSTNVCGTGSDSAVFSFTTRAIPPTLLVDDDDNGPDALASLSSLLTTALQGFDVWNTANSDNEPSAAELAPYKRVIWFTGDEFGGAAGPGGAGEAALTTWLSANTGNCLFLNSQDYLYDRGITTFGSTYLGIATKVDDEGHTTATGRNFFASSGANILTFPYTNFSDVVTATAGTLGAFNGTGGTTTGLASVYRDNDLWKTVFFSIPIESFPVASRQAVFNRVLALCDALFQDGFESNNTSRWSDVAP